jgi:hypothetical protein
MMALRGIHLDHGYFMDMEILKIGHMEIIISAMVITIPHTQATLVI